MPSRTIRILRTLVALAAPLALAFVIVQLAISREAPRTLAAWKTHVGLSPDELLARHPARTANAAAVALDAAAARLELPLLKEVEPDPPANDSEGPPAPRPPRPAKVWLDGSMLDGHARPFPPELETLLAEQDAALGGVLEVLRTSPPPEWPEDLQRWPDGPRPHFVNYIKLQELLCARAIHASQAGDPRRALDELALAWRLNASLLEHHELISVLIAVAVMRQHAFALRVVPGASSAWLAEREPLHPKDAIATMLLLEAASHYHKAQHAEWSDVGNLPDGVDFAPVFNPWLRHMLLESARVSAERLPLVADVSPCDVDALELLAGDLPDLRRAIPLQPAESYLSVLARGGRMELDLELTQRILELRSSRADGDVTDATPSLVCPGRAWITERVPGDKRRVHLEKSETVWHPDKGPDLSLEYLE